MPTTLEIFTLPVALMTFPGEERGTLMMKIRTAQPDEFESRLFKTTRDFLSLLRETKSSLVEWEAVSGSHLTQTEEHPSQETETQKQMEQLGTTVFLDTKTTGIG